MLSLRLGNSGIGANDRFPGFPTDAFPYASFRGVYYRKLRDAHLKDIIVQLLADRGAKLEIKNRQGQTPLSLTIPRSGRGGQLQGGSKAAALQGALRV